MSHDTGMPGPAKIVCPNCGQWVGGEWNGNCWLERGLPQGSMMTHRWSGVIEFVCGKCDHQWLHQKGKV